MITRTSLANEIDEYDQQIADMNSGKIERRVGEIFNKDRLAEQCGKFAESITPCRERWAYCFNAATYPYTDKYGITSLCTNARSISTCERITGIRKGAGSFALQQIRQLGLAEALNFTFKVSGRRLLTVGVMEAWHVGHVYFARLAAHPHIMKIGFSRRVRERLEDVESKAKEQLLLPGLQVGTLLDEQFWHKRYAPYRISGEWFFDPKASERSVPHFLSIEERKGA